MLLKKKPKTHHLHLLVTDQVRHRIAHLQERTDAGNMTEVIRRALAVYDELIALAEEGAEVFIEGPKTERTRLLIR